ncbi:MAG TPA: hypothetical protein VF168_01665 [Trueperaceae bacterium]
MKRRAQLADFTGTGTFTWESHEGGDRIFTGLWQPDDPDQAYDELHRLYMARERIPFRAPVVGRGEGRSDEETREVIILEWSNEEHPAAIKLQEATDEP